MIHLRIKFHTPRYKGSLVIGIKSKAMPLFYIWQEYCFKNHVYFSNIYYHTLFLNLKLNYTTIAPTLQIRPSAILLLMIIENHKVRHRGGAQWNNIYTKFRENR
jgi:hypothetical protein